MVVTEIEEEGVRLLDPVRGEVPHTGEKFNSMWQPMRSLTILIG